jgi:hypothetical protein
MHDSNTETQHATGVDAAKNSGKAQFDPALLLDQEQPTPRWSAPQVASWANPINGIFVTIYKIAGFVALASIVIAMASYLAASGFFALSRQWIVPEILGPEHDRVRSESMRHLEQKYQLSKLEMEKSEIDSQLSYLDQAIASKNNLEQAMIVAIQDSKARRNSLSSKLSARIGSLETSAPAALKAFDALRKAELKALADAGDAQLLGRNEILERKNMIDQIEMSSIERIRKITELRQQMPNFGQSLDTLRENRELLDLQLEKIQLESKRKPLGETVHNIQALIDSYQHSISLLEQSPFVQATNKPVTVALIPYENLRGVSKGSGIYGCYLTFIACRRVGTVERLVPGEVSGAQPFTGRQFRGQYLEISFKNSALQDWAQKNSLIVGSRPLLF